MINADTFQEAVDLFNRGAYFECHEVLEDLWRPLPASAEKTFLQGVLQVGVGFHHWQNGNLTGANNLLTAGLAKLEQVAQDARFTPPIQLQPLRTTTKQLLQQLQAEGNKPLPAFPKITLANGLP